MPQKKLPLVRAAAWQVGRLIGDLVGLLTVLKGLPAAYDKDLQEDKQPLFDFADTLELALPVAAGAIATARFNTERMRRARRRDARHRPGRLPGRARRGVPRGASGRGQCRCARPSNAAWPSRSCHSTFCAASPAFGEDGPASDPARSAAARAVPGATAPAAVRAQIQQAHACLGQATHAQPRRFRANDHGSPGSGLPVLLRDRHGHGGNRAGAARAGRTPGSKIEAVGTLFSAVFLARCWLSWRPASSATALTCACCCWPV